MDRHDVKVGERNKNNDKQSGRWAQQQAVQSVHVFGFLG